MGKVLQVIRRSEFGPSERRKSMTSAGLAPKLSGHGSFQQGSDGDFLKPARYFDIRQINWQLNTLHSVSVN